MTGLESCRRVGPSGPLGRSVGQVLQVGAGAEGLLVAGEHGHALRRRRRRRRANSSCSRAAVVAVDGVADARAWSMRTTPTPSGSSVESLIGAGRYRRDRARASAGSARRSAAASPRWGRPRGRRPTGCARRPSTPSAASARSTSAAVLDLFAGQRRARHRGAVARRRAVHLRRRRPRTRAVGHRGQPAHAPGWPTGPTVVRRRRDRAPGGDQRRRFDLALLDPPYAYDGWPELAARRCPAHAGGAASRPSRIGAGPRVGASVRRSKRYGGTVVVIARRLADP